jgi:hypothetical protein
MVALAGALKIDSEKPGIKKSTFRNLSEKEAKQSLSLKNSGSDFVSASRSPATRHPGTTVVSTLAAFCSDSKKLLSGRGALCRRRVACFESVLALFVSPFQVARTEL